MAYTEKYKFRGKTFSGTWAYGNLIVLQQKIRNLDAGTYISNSGGVPFAYLLIPETVGQFTGLRDKKDREIYEGDIITYNVSGTNRKKWTNKIIFVDGCLLIKNEDVPPIENGNIYNIEIVGNIHENPGIVKS